MFKRYSVELQFVNRFAAGIPKNPELLGTYLEVKGTGDVTEEELAGQVAEPSTDKWSVGFKGDGDGLYYEARCVKAHMKDCANILQKMLSVKALKSKLANHISVEPQEIRLLRDGSPISRADGTYEMPITVMTMQGPRTSIKRVDYVDAPTMRFGLVMLDDGVITEGMLEAIFGYGGTIKGMGQDRGLQNGRYKLVGLKTEN
jgi:hypothetical protein